LIAVLVSILPRIAKPRLSRLEAATALSSTAVLGGAQYCMTLLSSRVK